MEASPDRDYLDSVIAQSKQRLARIIDLEDAIENASYALNPNQGERPDPTVAHMWLRTTFPTDHPNYVPPDHPLLAGTDFAGRQ